MSVNQGQVCIRDLEVSQRVSMKLAMVEATLKQAKNGPYLSMVLADAQSTIAGKVWNYTSTEVPETGKVYEIHGIVQAFRGAKDLHVSGFSMAPDRVEDYLPSSAKSESDLTEYFDRELDQVENPYLNKMLKIFCADYGKSFFKAPAAVAMHHNYVRGLAEHSFDVLNQAVAIAKKHNEVSEYQYDIDLIRTGAVLHDLGKVRCYTFKKGLPAMTEIGQFADHLVIGPVMLYHMDAQISEEEKDPELLNLLIHIIASHHGQLEWGSPVKPKCPEAYIIHMADMLSSKLTMMDNHLKSAKPGWSTDKVFPFNVRMYKKGDES